MLRFVEEEKNDVYFLYTKSEEGRATICNDKLESDSFEHFRFCGIFCNMQTCYQRMRMMKI